MIAGIGRFVIATAIDYFSFQLLRFLPVLTRFLRFFSPGYANGARGLAPTNHPTP